MQRARRCSSAEIESDRLLYALRVYIYGLPLNAMQPNGKVPFINASRLYFWNDYIANLFKNVAIQCKQNYKRKVNIIIIILL